MWSSIFVGCSLAVRIASNITTLFAQRQLERSSTTLATTYERLATGQRINRASDDAAGLSISMRLDSSIRVANQGVRNVNDGISMLNIAAGATESLKSVVMRLQELATSSANGTLSTAQRRSLDKEAQELIKEHNRIIDTTSYNGVMLFSESAQSMSFQAGHSVLQANLAVDTVVGSGTFGNMLNSYASSSPRRPTVADVNNDGLPDLITVNSADNTIAVNIGNGDGRFKAPMTFATGPSPASWNFDVFDADNDGRLDVVVAVSSGIAVLKGNGDGTFAAPGLFSGIDSQTLTKFDANGDGIYDIFLGTSGTATSNVLMGNGDGTFRAPISIATPYRIGGHTAVGDFNNDGYDDVIGGTAGTGTNIVLSNGDGTFKNFNLDGIPRSIRSLSAADINGDGNLDFIEIAIGSDDVSVFFGNGDGTFRQETVPSGVTGAGTAILADLNGDGRADFVTGGGSQYAIALGNGDGTFGAAISYNGNNFYQLTVADLNNDGVPDVVGGYGATRIILGIATNAPRTLSQRKLSNLSVSTLSGARQAMGALSKQLTFINTVSSAIGVSQKRLSTAASVLQTSSQFTSAALQRIKDVDVAEESSRLASTQIIQQAAAAVLAHAAQEPALALKLLQS